MINIIRVKYIYTCLQVFMLILKRENIITILVRRCVRFNIKLLFRMYCIRESRHRLMVIVNSLSIIIEEFISFLLTVYNFFFFDICEKHVRKNSTLFVCKKKKSSNRAKNCLHIALLDVISITGLLVSSWFMLQNNVIRTHCSLKQKKYLLRIFVICTFLLISILV